MKKVVLLAPTPPPAGGIAGWTVRMLNARLKNDWQVAVVDEKSIGEREVFGKSGKRHLTDELKRCFIIWKGLWKELKDPDTKVVQSCIPAYSLCMIREYICACITKLHRRKFIIHFRCTVPNIVKRPYERFILKRMCNISDMIFSLNTQTSKYLSRITRTPIELIPNFISEEELIPERTVSKELKRIVYVGGLSEKKGIRDIITIAEKLPDIQFVLIGKGDSQFEEEAKKKDIKNVIFTGEKDRTEVKQELLQSDAFIFMTYFTGEGFSNSLCEAMAAGLPCIVTDWAANKDMIGNEGGAVVNVGDTEAAVKAINFMRKSEKRQQMSARNINTVRNEYLESIVINKYVDAYECIIEK